MLTPTITVSCVPRLAPKDARPSINRLQPVPHIIEAFRQYIHNDIPLRLIDTSKLQFIERDALFHVFFPEIAKITEEDIERQLHSVGVDTHPEAGNYVTLRKVALREMIRDVVRYAIFSHRWTDSEPSYQDVSEQRSIKAAGFVKLTQLCETARALGYKFIWSDTCCIDRTNTTELSEAIHAMFKWYAHAHVCIVHLGASLSLADFGHEPWFTRGWTLQELLAPRRIKFFGKGWDPLTTLVNDKDDPTLMHALSFVTRIPQDVVVADNSHGVKGHSVWEIMSWASTRKTTRVEDAAYCLFGLFDVNIPIAYGEGEKAFPRLVETIASRSWDVFAWAGQVSERHPALPSSPACYRWWDPAMVRGEVGLTTFTLTPHGLRLTSVPLIPMMFVSEVKARNRLYVVTLRPRLTTTEPPGAYSDVRVICGSNRLQYMRSATDLHLCILNYKPDPSNSRQGQLQVGRKYVCFLLHMQSGNAGSKSTWLKFATDNVLRITFKGVPAGKTSISSAFFPGPTPKMEDCMFDLPLKTTFIRVPRAHSMLRE